MTEKELYKAMDIILRELGCGPFTLWLLYYRYGSITLEEAANEMKVSHVTINKWNKILLKNKLINRSQKQNFSITDTNLSKIASLKSEDSIRAAHKIIVDTVLIHKRYTNNTYHKKNLDVITKKIYDYIDVMLNKKFKGSLKLVQQYCNWWISKKIQLQFNYGLFTCDSLVDEFAKAYPTVKHVTITSTKKTIRVKKKLNRLEAVVGTNKIHRKAI